MRSSFGVIGALVASLALAQAATAGEGGDHPLLGSFAGASIHRDQAYDYHAVHIPTGPVSDAGAPDEVLELEGRVSWIAYRLPEGKSPLEAARNYEQAFAEGGFDVLFACSGDECGAGFWRYLYRSGEVFPSAIGSSVVNHDHATKRVFVARKEVDGQLSHFLLYIVGQARGRPTGILQLSVDGVPMRTDQIAAMGAGRAIDAPVAALADEASAVDAVATPRHAATTGRPVLAVAEFVNITPRCPWWRRGVGWELSGMLANELSAIDAFTVVERRRLEYVLAEQDLGASGRVRPETAARIGELTGAQYIVLGTLTSYQENTRSTGGGVQLPGINIRGRQARIGGSGEVTEAYLAVDLRVVDASTGEVAHVRTIEGRSTGKGIKLRASRGGFGGNLSHQNDTPAGEAIRAALIEITDYLECAMVLEDGCLADYDAKEEQRRERTRGKLRF